jgi:hypothetical protein
MKVKTFIQPKNNRDDYMKLDELVNELNANRIISIEDSIERRDVWSKSFSEKYQGMESILQKNVPYILRKVIYE